MKAKPDVLPAPAPDRPVSKWEAAAVVALLGIYFGLAVSAVSGKSATADELFHLTAGYSYWTLGDFRMQPENGNLPQRWAALPLLMTNVTFPDLDQSAWRQADMVAMGDEFFYGSGNGADQMLLKGRAMVALVGVALGGLIFAWTRRLLGATAGLISLTLFAFCPTVLTHGALVTSDMTATAFFLATVSMIWVVLRRTTVWTLLVSILAMSGLFLAKYSAFLIIPMGVLLMALQLCTNQPLTIAWRQTDWVIRSRGARAVAQAAIVGMHVILVWCMIWAAYDFRFAMYRPTDRDAHGGASASLDDGNNQPAVTWDDLVKPGAGTIDQTLIALRDAHALPEGFLYGTAHTLHYSQMRRSFLNGQFSLTGWPQFFPYCLLVKTPLTLFLLMGLGGAAVLRSWQSSAPEDRWKRVGAGLYRTAPLWSLFVVYWGFAITSHLNIGHRHILPTYPEMFMLAGASALWLEPLKNTLVSRRAIPGPSISALNGRWRWVRSRRNPAIATITLLTVGIFAGESLAHWPNYLAYFNPLIGSNRNAYRHLVDSSLDWGQDLPALKSWLARQGLDHEADKPVYLSYFGSARPAYYSIAFEPLPSYFANVGLPTMPRPLQPGIYCISATMLQQVYATHAGAWSEAYERSYQQLRQNLQLIESTAHDPAARRALIERSGGEAACNHIMAMYQDARFARLCHYLRQREPDAEINYSILIYHLSAEDLKQALEAPPAGFAAQGVAHTTRRP